MNEEFQFGRLTIARERRGLSKEQLALKCGVTRRTVSDWEAGRIKNPPIDVLAAALDFPAEFFLGEPLDLITSEQASFRALTAMSARESKRVLANATVLQAFTEWIDGMFTTPAVEVPWFDQYRPITGQPRGRPAATRHLGAAEALRSMWHMNGKPIPDLLALVESKGVRVFGLTEDIREVDAFSLWLGERPTIFLNVDKSAERLRFDLAHEVGHLFMHRGVVTVGSRVAEIEANNFASEFLMPGDGVMAKVMGSVQLTDVFSLKRYWRVSAVAMVVRLHHLQLINDWQYRNWMVDLSKKGFRRAEPDGIHPERSELLAQVMRLAREDGWSVRKMSKQLRIPHDDLIGAVSGLTLTAVA